MTSAAPPSGFTASSAQQVSAGLAAALSGGALDAATACFTRDACLVTPGTTTIHSRQHIRPILAQLIDMRASVQVEQRSVLISGEIALAAETWTILLDGLDLTPFAQTSDSTAVMRRVEDNWKLQIAAPWGWG